MPRAPKLKVLFILLAVTFVASAGMVCPMDTMPLQTDTNGLVTLRIQNHSGLPATVNAEYILSEKEVRKTLRFLEQSGPNSEVTILPTQTSVLRVAAHVAPEMTTQQAAMAKPGDLLIERTFLWQIDFQNGDTINFIIPPPQGPPPGDIIDCNSNGISDILDLGAGTSQDCNTNSFPDECDIAEDRSTDCNSNGIPDECDIAGGVSADCNSNGVPDECDIAAEDEEDCNHNMVPDSCDVITVDGFPMIIRSVAGLLFPRDETFQLAMEPNDDDSSEEIELGFDFEYFGVIYDSVFINNNGNLTFLESFGGFVPSPFPYAGRKIIAPFWADVDTRLGHGNVWYKIEENTLIVTWEEVGYFDQRGDKRNTFQVAISDGTNEAMGIGANIVFCYGDMQWTTGFASGSNTGFGGIPATVGANAGDGENSFLIGLFNKAGDVYDGPDGATDGVDFLDWKCFAFGADEPEVNQAPIPLNLPPNCFVRINPSIGQALDLNLEFASPEDDQTTAVIVTDLAGAGLRGLQTASTPGSVAAVHLIWSPDCDDAGLYGLSFSAIDDFTPPATSVSHFWIEVACTSYDCNDNGIPDECEPDCNANGIPDDCEMAHCEGNPGCGDCNENNILDECDIQTNFSEDYNTDGLPDECDDGGVEGGVLTIQSGGSLGKKSVPEVAEVSTPASPAD